MSCALCSAARLRMSTYYFAYISVQFLLSKEHVLHFTTLIFFFFLHLVFTFLPYGTVFLACLLVEMNESEVHRHAKITVTQPLQY